MRWSLYARSLTAALLVTSAALALLGAAERWLTACGGILSWETEPCIRRQDHLYDSVIPTEPWLSSGDAAEFLGLAYLLLAAAVVLTPAALGRRSTWWQALSVAVVGIVLASVGALTLASGLAGEVVAIPAVELLSLLFYLVPPFVVALGLFPRDADDRKNGTFGSLTASMVMLAMPICTRIWWPVSSHDTPPWTEGAMALPLLVAALSMRPWARDRAAPDLLVPAGAERHGD